MEAAFFDLDKTIISRSSSLALSRPLYRAGMVSRGQLLRGAYAQLVYLLGGGGREQDGAAEGGHARPHQGVGPFADRASGAGRAARRDRPVRLPGGPRPHGSASQRGAAYLHRVVARPRRSSARSLAISASAGSSPLARRSATMADTRAIWSSTRTANRRPRRSMRSRRGWASTSRGRTPTATPSRTCRCSRSSASRWR